MIITRLNNVTARAIVIATVVRDNRRYIESLHSFVVSLGTLFPSFYALHVFVQFRWHNTFTYVSTPLTFCYG